MYLLPPLACAGRVLHVSSLVPPIPSRARTMKAMQKGKRRYFTVIEVLWKIVAPIVVALVKTLLEGKVRLHF